MILIDTGPIVAMIDKKDDLHERAKSALKRLGLSTFLTTDACVTESTFHLWDADGWRGISQLRSLIETRVISIDSPATSKAVLAFAYMKRFRDIPCDYADATLLVAAEETGARQIFTFDRHFFAYRLLNGDHLNVIS